MTNVVIFIDESGIHKSQDHSAFAMAYIEFENVVAVEQGIVEIEQKHGISSFKWTDLPWKLREAFITDVAHFPFKAKVVVFHKPIHPDQALEWSAQHLLVEKNFKTVYVDGKKPRWVELRLKKVLRDKGVVLEKKRLSPIEISIIAHRGVIDPLFEGTYVIIDDISSTGNTLWSAVEYLRRQGAAKISCFVFHNLLKDESVIEKFRGAGIGYFFSNTLVNKGAAIAVVSVIAEEVRVRDTGS